MVVEHKLLLLLFLPLLLLTCRTGCRNFPFVIAIMNRRSKRFCRLRGAAMARDATTDLVPTAMGNPQPPMI
jgi:hypothetical protein